jgi:hypothetical protein
MFVKSTLSTALVLSVLGLAAASADPIHMGGPRGSLATPVTSGVTQVDNAYAQALPVARTGVIDHIYAGGPKSAIAHRRSR